MLGRGVRPGLYRYATARALCAIVLAAATIAAVDPNVAPEQVPAGTPVHFHLTAALSSDESTSGQPFAFVLLEPIRVGDRVVAVAGAVGRGTLILAGHAGMKGHEGDLTLRLDSVPSADGGQIVFDNQRFEINGTNEKAMSALAGFIPFVGFFAQFMRGQEIHLPTNLAIETTLLRPATIVAPPPFCATPTPLPTPTPIGTATPFVATTATPS
ncbi:MAG TPA: hypothetical protein VJP76_05220, partial [Candidatus Tumulicola sp.]|nr:hypothetical protein [Candidatus Tumulicola sp.]